MKLTRDINEYFILMYKLIREGIFEDVALLNSRCMKSIKDFRDTAEMMEYAQNTYCDSMTIKLAGQKNYNHTLYFHRLNGFKLNRKSVVFYMKDGNKKIIRW